MTDMCADPIENEFVETAYTTEQVDRAIAAEERLGIRNGPCAFLGELNQAFMAGQISNTTAQADVIKKVAG